MIAHDCYRGLCIQCFYGLPNISAVSYTHLDVYKRQDLGCDLTAMKDAQQASADWIDAYGTSDTPEANALRQRIGDLFARSEGTMN